MVKVGIKIKGDTNMRWFAETEKADEHSNNKAVGIENSMSNALKSRKKI